MEREKRIWDALKEYGITSETELDEAIKNSKPLNIGIMTRKPKRKETAV